jgi:hypothetical protein
MYRYFCARLEPCKEMSKPGKVGWTLEYKCVEVEELPNFSNITQTVINYRNESINIITNPTHGYLYVYIPYSYPFEHRSVLSYIWYSMCTDGLDQNSAKYTILNCFKMTEEEYYERFIK